MPESEAPRPGGIREAWDEVDLLRGTPDVVRTDRTVLAAYLGGGEEQ